MQELLAYCTGFFGFFLIVKTKILSKSKHRAVEKTKINGKAILFELVVVKTVSCNESEKTRNGISGRAK